MRIYLDSCTIQRPLDDHCRVVSVLNLFAEIIK